MVLFFVNPLMKNQTYNIRKSPMNNIPLEAMTINIIDFLEYID